MQRDADSAPPLEILNRVINDIEYDDYLFELHKAPAKIELRQKRIEQLRAWIAKLQEERFETLDGLMQHLTLLDILDRQEQEQDAIQLMTLHSAKRAGISGGVHRRLRRRTAAAPQQHGQRRRRA